MSAQARAEALGESGWGERFRLVQPRNPAFWVLAAGLAAGAVLLVRYYLPAFPSVAAGVGVGVLLSALYLIPWLLLLNRHNRFTRLPGRLLLVAFAWGAVVSSYVMASRANTAVLVLWTKAFGATWTHDWGAGLTAPFIEEPAKATALILLLGLAPRLLRGPHDGLIVGAYAGLGMQISEDVMYAASAAVRSLGYHQTTAAAQVIALRAVAGLFQHVMLSAIFCSGLMWLLGRGPSPHRARGLLMMLGAVAMHSAWDNGAAYGVKLFGVPSGLATILVWLIVAVLGSVLLVRTFKWAVPQEQAWIRAVLTPETETGLLNPAEVWAAAATRAERHAFRQAGGDPRVIKPAYALARELAHSSGTETERVTRARAAIEKLRLDS